MLFLTNLSFLGFVSDTPSAQNLSPLTEILERISKLSKYCL